MRGTGGERRKLAKVAGEMFMPRCSTPQVEGQAVETRSQYPFQTSASKSR